MVRRPFSVAMVHEDVFSDVGSGNNTTTPNPWAEFTSPITAPSTSHNALLSKILASKAYRYTNDNRTPHSSTSTNPAAPPPPPGLQEELLSKLLALKPSKSLRRGITTYAFLWRMHAQVVARASSSSSVFRLDIPLHSFLLEIVVDVTSTPHPPYNFPLLGSTKSVCCFFFSKYFGLRWIFGI